MPNIPSFPRGLAETFQNIKQSENPVGTIKTGFYGENKKFDIGDLATPFKNIGKGYATAGTGGALLGAFQTLADYFKSGQSMQPTSNVGQLAQYDFGGDQFGTSPFSPFYNPFAPTQYDMSGMMPMLNTQISNMFQTPTSSPSQRMFTSGSMPRSSMIQNELPINDIVNKIEVPTDSGLQMTPESGQQQAPAPTAPKITPSKMPAKSFEETFYNPLFVNNKIDPSKAMTTNKGYFDMGKANTAGGNWIPNVGWYTEADKMAGLKEEDLIFNREMQNRIASMFQ